MFDWFYPAFIFIQCQEDAQQQIREFKEIIKQVEEDEERKIHDIQIQYEKKLHTEKEANTNLKGETGMVTQKVGNVSLVKTVLLSAVLSSNVVLLFPRLSPCSVLQSAEADWWQMHRHK